MKEPHLDRFEDLGFNFGRTYYHANKNELHCISNFNTNLRPSKHFSKHNLFYLLSLYHHCGRLIPA